MKDTWWTTKWRMDSSPQFIISCWTSQRYPFTLLLYLPFYTNVLLAFRPPLLVASTSFHQNRCRANLIYRIKNQPALCMRGSFSKSNIKQLLYARLFWVFSVLCGIGRTANKIIVSAITKRVPYSKKVFRIRLTLINVLKSQNFGKGEGTQKQSPRVCFCADSGHPLQP